MSPVDFEALFTLWRAGDAARAAAFFAPDGVYREPRKPLVVGRAAIAAHWAPFFAGGPAWRFDVAQIFGDGERFAVAYTWQIEVADGTWKSTPGCALVTTRDGVITEWREYEG